MLWFEFALTCPEFRRAALAILTDDAADARCLVEGLVLVADGQGDAAEGWFSLISEKRSWWRDELTVAQPGADHTASLRRLLDGWTIEQFDPRLRSLLSLQTASWSSDPELPLSVLLDQRPVVTGALSEAQKEALRAAGPPAFLSAVFEGLVP